MAKKAQNEPKPEVPPQQDADMSQDEAAGANEEIVDESEKEEPKATKGKGKATAAKDKKATATKDKKDNDAQHEYTFEDSGAGASLTFPLQCSALRINGHVVIKGRPCKIIDMSTSKTGKHGHAKVNLVATDIFTGRKYEDLSPSTHNMDVPNIKREDFTLLNVDDDFLNLLDSNNNPKDDVKVPEGELGEKLVADFEDGKELLVTVLAAMGEEAAIAYKEAPKGK
ncbi:translation initiation factor eIF5A [Coemansia sp. BCRC 34301]|nr:translation initiation factor eIF5A [Coemansia sp. BCRC 34301]